jgi:hypothetical protein
MSRDTAIKEDFEKIKQLLSAQFNDNEPLEVDGIIYLIGLQELGQPHKIFQKDEKLNLMHIAICRLLEPFGYYEFSHFDDDKWPHYNLVENIPPLKAGEQSVLIKEAIVMYFRASGML